MPAAKTVKEVLLRMMRHDGVPGESLEGYAKKITRLDTALQREKRKNEKLLAGNQALKERNQYLEGLTASYERTINQMSGFKNSNHQEIRQQDVEIPASFKDMTAWVELYLAGRLYLHPRAIEALAKAKYDSPKLVYKILLALAFEYRDFCLKLGSENKFKAKCSELGIRRQVIVSENQSAKELEPYYVNYPYHSTERRLLEFVLAKGNARRRESCLRIYFFWDEVTKEVVVGHLPSHIDNKATKGNGRD